MPVSDAHFGIWPGRVVSTDDPEKRGRVRVRVHQVYGDPLGETDFIQDVQLPWAEPCMPVTGVLSGMWWVPTVESAVWVMFWQGDTDNPVWMGGWYPTLEQPPESVYEGSTPAAAVFRTEAGHLFEMRDFEVQRKIQLTTVGGSRVRLTDAVEESGPKVEITTPAGRTVVLDDFTGKITVQGPTEVQVYAPSVVLGTEGGVKKQLATEDFVVTVFNLHTHPTAALGPPSPPSLLGIPGTHTTTATKAD